MNKKPKSDSEKVESRAEIPGENRRTINGILRSLAVAAVAYTGYTGVTYGIEENRLMQMDPDGQVNSAARGVDGWGELSAFERFTLLGPYLAALQYDTRTSAQATLSQKITE